LLYNADYKDGEEIDVDIHSSDLQIIVDYIKEYNGEFKNIETFPLSSMTQLNSVLTEFDILLLKNLDNKQCYSLFNSADVIDLECLKKKISFYQATKFLNNPSIEKISDIMELATLLNRLNIKKS
jgi:hypothetical protein